VIIKLGYVFIKKLEAIYKFFMLLRKSFKLPELYLTLFFLCAYRIIPRVPEEDLRKLILVNIIEAGKS